MQELMSHHYYYYHQPPLPPLLLLLPAPPSPQLCVILEPMQELMSRHKAYGLTPRDCLKTTLFQKWQRMVAPPGQCPRRSHAPSDQDTTPPPVDSVAGATITPAAVAAARSKTTSLWSEAPTTFYVLLVTSTAPLSYATATAPLSFTSNTTIYPPSKTAPLILIILLFVLLHRHFKLLTTMFHLYF